jgi:hypothetical protein
MIGPNRLLCRVPIGLVYACSSKTHHRDDGMIQAEGKVDGSNWWWSMLGTRERKAEISISYQIGTVDLKTSPPSKTRRKILPSKAKHWCLALDLNQVKLCSIPPTNHRKTSLDHMITGIVCDVPRRLRMFRMRKRQQTL